MTPAQEFNLLRIVQEALTNLCRHSHATQAWVTVDSAAPPGERPTLVVEIRDDGVGFDAAALAGVGWGIKNMQRRAEQLGATLSLHSQPGQGSVVRLAV